MKLLNQEQTLSLAAVKSGMDEKTARKYRRLRKLPSEMNKERDWRTREDSFKEMWEKVRSKLELNPGLQAKTLFKDLQRRRHLSIMLCPTALLCLELGLEQSVELVERALDGCGDAVPLSGLEGGDDDAQFEFRGFLGVKVSAAISPQNL